MSIDDEPEQEPRSAPDYAGKSGGGAGGPGGHARDRLEELIAQRVPADPTPRQDDQGQEHDDRSSGGDAANPLDEAAGPSGDEETHEEGQDDEGRAR